MKNDRGDYKVYVNIALWRLTSITIFYITIASKKLNILDQ